MSQVYEFIADKKLTNFEWRFAGTFSNNNLSSLNSEQYGDQICWLFIVVKDRGNGQKIGKVNRSFRAHISLIQLTLKRSHKD